MVLVICLCGAKFANVDLLLEHAVARGHFYQCTSVQCGRLFQSLSRAQDHQKSTSHSGTVKKLDFLKGCTTTPNSGDDNLKCRYCGTNKKLFKDSASLRQHEADKHPSCSTCPKCNEVFYAQSHRLEHQKVARHCCCTEHNIAFGTLEEYDSHMHGTLHTTGFQCMDCEREFGTQQGLDDHLSACPANTKELSLQHSERAKATFAAVEQANLRCEECQRTFKNLKAFQQHKESIKHKPLTYFTCNVVPSKCNQAFTSYSAWFLHIESGKCKSGMTRKTLYNMVHIGDTERLITYARNAPDTLSLSGTGLLSHASITGSRVSALDSDFDRLSISGSTTSGVLLTPDGSETLSESSSTVTDIVTPDDSDTSSTHGVLLTPTGTDSRSRSSSTSGVLITPTASVNSRSEWSYITDSHKLTSATTSIDGSSTETIIYDTLAKIGNGWPCPTCSHSFKTKKRLMQHMESPAHDPKLFHCPPADAVRSTSGKPEKTFKTLSGFAQHVEAGACDGDRDLLKGFLDVCQKESKIATGQAKKLIGSNS